MFIDNGCFDLCALIERNGSLSLVIKDLCGKNYKLSRMGQCSQIRNYKSWGLRQRQQKAVLISLDLRKALPSLVIVQGEFLSVNPCLVLQLRKDNESNYHKQKHAHTDDAFAGVWLDLF